MKAKIEFPMKGCGISGAKKERHKRKGRSEAGRMKSGCKANWRERGACRVGRAYKWDDYPTIMNAIDKKAAPTSSTAKARVNAFNETN
jgi:hypothetical protein